VKLVGAEGRQRHLQPVELVRYANRPAVEEQGGAFLGAAVCREGCPGGKFRQDLSDQERQSRVQSFGALCFGLGGFHP
jgi:hypothetical protein